MKTNIIFFVGMIAFMLVLSSFSKEFNTELNMSQGQPNASAHLDELFEVITLKSGVVVVKKGDLYFLGDDMLLTNKQVEILGETGNAFFSDADEPVDTVSVEKIPAQAGIRYYYPKQTAEDGNQAYKNTGAKAFGNNPTAFSIWAMVRYTLDPSLDLWQLWSIVDAITHIESVTNVRFYNATGQPTTLYGVSCDWINFRSCGDSASYSNIGRIGGMQIIGVNEWATDGIVAHEICHAVGLFHEHMRYDRDTYIDVNLSNVASANQSNFTKITSNYSATGSFDWNSIMLYSSFDFAINPSVPVMTRKDDGNTFVGQRIALSTLDRSWINNLHLPYLPRLDTWVDLDATVYKPDNTVMTSLERENLIKSLNGGTLPPPPPVISGPDQACSPSYYSLTTPLPPQAGTIYWSLTGPFSFSSSSSVTTTTGNNTNVYKTSNSGSGTLTARLGAANGPIINTKAITPCPPPTSITGPSHACINSTATFSVSNPPAGYTWTCSANLSPLSASGNSQSFKVNSYASSTWVAVNAGGTELVRYYFNSTYGMGSISIDGPEFIPNYNTYASWTVSVTGDRSAVMYYQWQGFGQSKYTTDSGDYSFTAYFPQYLQNYNETVYVYVEDCCGNYESDYIDVLVDSYKKGGTVYPNPVDDILTVEIEKQSANYNIRLYDINGAIRRQATSKGSNVEFNVSNLPNGIYSLHIYDGTNNRPEMRTIMVQH